MKVFPNGEKRLLDTDEYELHKARWRYPADVDYIVREHVKILVDWINNQQGPFSDAYIDLWYRRYLEIKRRNSQQ